MVLLHVTTPSGWAAIQASGTLDAAPFVHLCTEEQLAFVLDRHFAPDAKLVLVRVDAAALDVRWVYSEPGMDPFPHLYGGARGPAILGAEAL